jgi:hypothetical protein
MLKLFSRPKIDRFAKELATELARSFPPSVANEPRRKVSPHRLTRILENTLDKARAFSVQHKLGVVGKAKLGNNFRWELKELGYNEAFVELATEGVIVYVTRGEKPDAKKPEAK